MPKTNRTLRGRETELKLTNYMRDAYVRSVMNDVPSVEHDEALRKAIVAAAITYLPKKVAAVWNDAELKQWITMEWMCIERVSACIPFSESGGHEMRKQKRAAIESDAEVQRAAIESDAEVQRIAGLMKAQKKAHQDLESKVRSVAYGMTTRKALADALPEFAKYLPADEMTALRTLPVVANVVSEFVKAGWPKGIKKPASRQGATK